MIDTDTAADTTIETVAQSFASWRLSRKNRQEPIPLHLWQAAAKLCKTHRISHICQRLRLSSSDLKRHLPVEEPFVELGTGTLFTQWQLSCQRPDGATLQLNSSGPIPEIGDLIRQFLS
jgi:hypothetical protein